MSAAIQVRDFDLWYGAFQALRRVTLDVEAHTITALVGPSGCGKTTLLRAMNRMTDRASDVRMRGELRVLGQRVDDPGVSLASLRRQVAMVFQRPNPLPTTVYENVAFGLRIHGRAPARAALDAAVEGALTRVDLWRAVRDRLHVDARSLSLEAQQKLCIARTLPLEPSVLLMDEPCSALDAVGTERVEALMAELARRLTIVIVTHNMAQARRVGRTCAFMWLGELVEHGPTTQLFEAASDPRTRAYLGGDHRALAR
jgi:phosphate transport system ATP-binding protein